MVKSKLPQWLQHISNPGTTARAWLRLVAKRLLRLAAAAALLLVIYNVWNIASLQSQQQLTEHTRQVVNLALDQVEHASIAALQNNDDQQLAAVAQQLQQHASIISVVIRTPTGTVLVEQGSPTSIIDWPADRSTPWIMTREIGQQHLVGYLQVMLAREQLMETSNSAHDGLMQQGQILLLLAMLAGVFIMLGVNRIRDRFWERNNINR